MAGREAPEASLSTMPEGRRGSRRAVLAAAAATAVLVGAAAAPHPTPPLPDRRPNVVVILSDDQTLDTLPHRPAVMPFLQQVMQDPRDHWITFPNAFLNTPLCCPSRATILTGRYSHHTGVRNNSEAIHLDEANTVATWLHDAGYTTGLVGKYLNRYPFHAAPYVPPGWDRWEAKIQGSGASVYYDYVVSRQGFPVAYGHGPEDYSTDVFAGLAEDFIRSAPGDRPFFLLFAPTGGPVP
jgi:arylsulfatase A-like enzyme